MAGWLGGGNGDPVPTGAVPTGAEDETGPAGDELVVGLLELEGR